MDQTILLAFYHVTSSNAALSALAVFFAEWFPYLVVFAVACFAFLEGVSLGMVRAFLRVCAPATIALFIAEAVKFTFPAMRPFALLHFTPLVLGENPLASFPSTHATIFAAFGTTIFLRNKKTGKWFLLSAFLIGLARIAVGIHWPSDILAGFFLGGLVAYLFEYVWKKFSNESLLRR